MPPVQVPVKSVQVPAASAAPPVQAPAAASADVLPVETKVEEVEADLGSQIDQLRAAVSVLEKGFSEKVKTFKLIEQELKKISIAYRKESKRKYKKTKTGASTSHGFNASVSISKKLAEFLEVPEGTKFRRPEVTILISDYAKKQGLKNPENKGIYLPDDRLKALFGPPIYPLRSDKATNGYDMFNLQKYMKPHFEKKETV
jgi:chromatin remodeling complex protein RSC6